MKSYDQTPSVGLLIAASRLITLMLVILIGCHQTGVPGAESTAVAGSTPGVSEVVVAARCRVRCLSQLQTTIEIPLLSHVKESVSLLSCLRDTDCTSCLKPCNQPVLSQTLCEDVCKSPKEERVCVESCRFLRDAKTVHQGSCPPHEVPRGVLNTEQRCTTTCESDTNCDTHQKCCNTRCGATTCQNLINLFEGVPETPEAPSLRERPKGGTVELRWNPAASNTSGEPVTLVLYLIDTRWNVGKQFNEADMTPWQQVAQTTATSASVADVTPGRWYQFRVTSVSVRGSRGPSQPTKPFTLSKAPRKPDPPTNLTEGDTLIMGSRMAVTIHWFPPKKSDLPVTRYKLYWSRRSKSTLGPAPREYKQVLPGHRLVYQIVNLESDTTYFVQVQAICQYGDVRLKSSRAAIFITTYPLPKPDDHLLPVPTDSAVNRHVVTPPPVMALNASKPFFQNGVLKVNVSWTVHKDQTADKALIYWSPEACIADSSLDDGLSRVMSSSTKDGHFVIYDLRFDCRYLVKVESVSSQGITGGVSQISFSTPSCGQAPTFGKVKPECLDDGPRITDEPPDFIHRILITGSNVTSRLSWGVPGSDSPITGYRVVWAQLLNPHHTNPTLDKMSMYTKVLPKETRSLIIGNLLEGTTYSVQLQALTRVGAGRVASIQFATPLLSVAPIDPPYQDIGHHPDSRKQDGFRRGKNQTTTTAASLPRTAPPTLRTTTTRSRYHPNASTRLRPSPPLSMLTVFVLPILQTLFTRTARILTV